ncbi:MAG: TIGR03936 family radical SAM-associated protein [Defluviitaleaceae bacterium]|nr:TIGR03936 family radical SAM-associated protein [Defluviitaleaceae bacterium]
MNKIRLRFSKFGTLAFIGHLDFLRVFQQTIRRAALPAAFSQGFNPHLLLSFALPLPLGMESANDYVDLTLAEDMPCDEIAVRLNSAAPNGLVIHAAYPASDKAASVVVAADYVITTAGAPPPHPRKGSNAPLDPDIETAFHAVSEKVSERMAEILRAKEIIVPKKTKKGVRDTDIRGDIFGLEMRTGTEMSFGFEGMCSNVHAPPAFGFEGMCCDSHAPPAMHLRLAAGSARFLNPLIVAELLLGEKPCVSAITRVELYRDGETGLVRL